MRILHFCNYADRIGGAEVYAHALVAALRERGHEVSLFGTSPDADVDELGLRVVRRPLYDRSRLVRDVAVHRALDVHVERFRPDVLHVHNLFSVALEVVQALGGYGVPLVHTVHDFQLLCPNSWCVRGDGSMCPGGAGAQCFQHGCQRNARYDAWDVLLSGVRQQLAARSARIALAPSACLAERLRAHGWPDVRHVPYFVDFTPVTVESGDPFELLYVGRLEREKGVHVLLDALPSVSRRFPEVHLSVLGDGSQARALRAQARKLGVAGRVSFSSHIARAELPARYARAAACVLPSLWAENSPLVAYECLVSGLPMIGSRRGGIPELIEPDCGFTFEAGDPADLARAVEALLELPQERRADLRRAARIRAAEHGKDAHVTTVERVYDEAVEPAGTERPDRSDLLPVLAQLESERTRSQRYDLLARARTVARALRLPKVLPERDH